MSAKAVVRIRIDGYGKEEALTVLPTIDLLVPNDLIITRIHMPSIKHACEFKHDYKCEAKDQSDTTILKDVKLHVEALNGDPVLALSSYDNFSFGTGKITATVMSNYPRVKCVAALLSACPTPTN